MFDKTYFLKAGLTFTTMGVLVSLLLHFYSVPILVFFEVVDIPPGILNAFNILTLAAFFLTLIVASGFGATRLHIAGFYLGFGYLLCEQFLMMTYFPLGSPFYVILKGVAGMLVASGMGAVVDRILFITKARNRPSFSGPLYFLSSFFIAALPAPWLTELLIKTQNVSHFEGANGYAYLFALPAVFLACTVILWLLYIPIHKKRKFLTAVNGAYVFMLIIFSLKYRNELLKFFS